MKRSTRVGPLLLRTLVPVAVALVVILSLPFAGSEWFNQVQRWLSPVPHSAPPRIGPGPGPGAAPVLLTPARPLGNNSSVSRVPLPLVLIRTQPGRNSREGLAQIGVNAQTPQTYAAGALLANGARLTEVFDRYVMLEKGGDTVRLFLRGEPQPDEKSEASLLTVGGVAPPARAVANSRDILSAYLRWSPVFTGSQLHGYALYPGRNPFPFAHLGLASGDVLTSIDGSPISNPADAAAALHSLSQGGDLVVGVERRGSLVSLSLDGSVLTKAAEADSNAGHGPSGLYDSLRRTFQPDSAIASGRSPL